MGFLGNYDKSQIVGQACYYTGSHNKEAMASVAPGISLGVVQKFPIDFKIF